MDYRIHQIKLDLSETVDSLPQKISKKIGRPSLEITDYEIVRESIDARNKSDIKMVYTVDFNAEAVDGRNLRPNAKIQLEYAPDLSYREVDSGTAVMKNRPVVVGFGPCGMFAALILARRGYKPLVIERGSVVDKRVMDVERFWKTGELNTESNVQFGEGGAGTFSDGKLTTGIKDYRIRHVLNSFVKAGACSDILYKHKPHIGTDVLRVVVKNIREEIIASGGEIRFDTRVTAIKTEGDNICGIVVDNGSETFEISADNVIFAIGHSARDTFRQLVSQGVIMEQKPFSIGVRIEHPQDVIDESQYGSGYGEMGLPPADYKLSYHCKNGRGVYTFCMCPGGQVILASSQEGGVVTNGMSNRKRNSGTANSALLVDVRKEDFSSTDPLAGVEFQEKYERLAFEMGGSNYCAPVTTWGEFKNNSEAAQAVIGSLPEFAVEGMREAMPYFGRRIKGFDGDRVVMTAVEARSSSPVRFSRDENMEGNYKGFYPAGEGAGYAGGIMSAACDGIKVAEKIIEKYKPIF